MNSVRVADSVASRREDAALSISGGNRACLRRILPYGTPGANGILLRTASPRVGSKCGSESPID
ncbi:hypothetical protein [Nostoc sp.]